MTTRRIGTLGAKGMGSPPELVPVHLDLGELHAGHAVRSHEQPARS